MSHERQRRWSEAGRGAGRGGPPWGGGHGRCRGGGRGRHGWCGGRFGGDEWGGGERRRLCGGRVMPAPEEPPTREE